jgi:3-deoxy-D-manno-octulosonic-acid transferase
VALEKALRSAGLASKRLEEVERTGRVEGADVIVVDRVGVLAALYTVGEMAYVGGGFGTDGLHSVLEPAAAGLPILFGPHHAGSKAAKDLLACGGGVGVKDARELSAALERWLSDSGISGEASRQAQRYIEAHRGAARRTAEALVRFFPQKRGA